MRVPTYSSTMAMASEETSSQQQEFSRTVEKLEVDCLKILSAVEEMLEQGEKQSLRSIAERAGLNKDEVNRYVNPQVNETYNYDRLVHVRGMNRPLYNYLITSGPPVLNEEGKWAGIQANTSKHTIFEAVARKFGYLAKYIGRRGEVLDLSYVGIEELSYQRQGIAFSFQEPVFYLDQYRPV